MFLKIFLAALIAACSFAAHADGLLTSTGHQGEISVTRGTTRGPLRKDTILSERDVITLAPAARVSLDISKHGFMELGSQAELSLERLPFATYADDLRTVLRLVKGYLRLVWRHPSLSTTWPMFVHMGNYRFSLTSGEFFFENEEGKLSVCIGGGEIALTSTVAPEPVTLNGPACYRLIPGLSPQLVEQDYETLNTARSGYTLGTLADLEPKVVAAAPQSDMRIPFPALPAPTAPVLAPAAPPAPSVPLRQPVPRKLEPAAEPEFKLPVVVYAPIEDTPPPELPPRVETEQAPTVATVQTKPPAPAKPLAPAPAPVVAAVPAPRKPSAAAQARTGGWILNIASFPAKIDAEMAARNLVDAGYPARVVEATVKGRTWYRVQLPGQESVQQAGELAAELDRKLGIKNAWVIR